jgi:hypothetical protein
VALVTACATHPPNAGETGMETVSKTVSWRTEFEEDNYGFFLERADSPDGPFIRLNDALIAGYGTTSVPHDYAFEDHGLQVGATYYYRLWSVTYQGHQELIGEIRKTIEADAPDSGADSPR